MKNLALINYWNRFYATNKHMQASSFARFVNRKIIKKRTGNLIDIGCGNGRDCLFFSRNGHNVLGIDMSAEAILSNSRFSNKKLKFLKLDIGKGKINKKFDFVYCRFFLHAIDTKNEKKLLNFIKNIKKKNTYCFFEFRNHKDEIFKNKSKKDNEFVEFEKGHFRRLIDPEKFLNVLKEKFDIKILYQKSSKNLSIVKKDNPNLTRIIFIFNK